MNRIFNNKGDGSALPILFILIISISAVIIILIKQVDTSLIAVQKARYTKAIEMSLNTALASIELSPSQNPGEETNLEKLAMGYTIDNKMQVNTEKLRDVFLQTLFNNVQAKNIRQQEQFKRFVPLLAVVQYDRIWLNAYCDSKYVSESPLTYYDNDDNKYYYLTLRDEYYSVNVPPSDSDPTPWKKEDNRTYYNINNPANNPAELTEAIKNKHLADIIESSLSAFADGYSESHKGYKINIGNFDKEGFSNSVKDVSVFCFVEGIPIKSILSDEPDRSFYAFRFGGASIKRVDQ